MDATPISDIIGDTEENETGSPSNTVTFVVASLAFLAAMVARTDRFVALSSWLSNLVQFAVFLLVLFVGLRVL